MPLVAWLHWIRESHRLNQTHPEFHPATLQDLNLISKRWEITTCYQHRLIPDLPSVIVVTITFFFFLVDVSFLKFQRDECDISWLFWLNLNPSRRTICPGQERTWTQTSRVSTLKTKDKHYSEPFVSTCCSTHLLIILCCAVRWKIVFWV